MKANRLFSQVIRPLPDEVLSSWIYRGVKLRDSKLTELAMVFYAEGITDPDHSDSEKTAQIIQSIFGHSALLLKTLVPKSDFWIPPPKYRRRYCEECIYDDISRGHHPGFRKYWIYRWAVGCPVHSSPLSTALTDPFEDIKNSTQALLAGTNTLFSQELSYLQQTRHELIHSCKFSCERGYFLIAFYFQKWLSRQMQSSRIVLPNGQAVSAFSLFQMIEIISEAAMRPHTPYERYTSSAYSYLPKRKWPYQGIADLPLINDVAAYPVDLVTGFLGCVSMLLKIPSCCIIWGILSRHGFNYWTPTSCSLFPDDDRNYHQVIIDQLSANPLLGMVQGWLLDR